MNFEEAQVLVKGFKTNFKWESDGKLDSFHILTPDENGIYRGDCDDFVMTVLFKLCGESYVCMWLWLIFFKAMVCFVTSPNGVPHVVLWVRGYGYVDNWRDSWSPTEDIHTKRFPYYILPPVVALKMAIGLFDKT